MANKSRSKKKRREDFRLTVCMDSESRSLLKRVVEVAAASNPNAKVTMSSWAESVIKRVAIEEINKAA